MDNVSVLSALVGFGIVFALAVWVWRDRNAKKLSEKVNAARDAVKETASEAAAKVKAKVKK